MKNHVMLFEEFVTSGAFSNPTEEESLKKQFTTSNYVGSIVTTHEVSEIKSDETGIHTAIGNQDGTGGQNIPLPVYKQDEVKND